MIRSWNAFTRGRIGGSVRKRCRKARLRIARRKHNAAGESAVEKPLPQPRQRRVCGYISNVSTIDPKVTFLNGLTPSGRLKHMLTVNWLQYAGV